MELGQFVQYMADMDMEALGSNCANVYYKHPQDPNGVERLVTRAGDRIMCKLMSGALFFLYQSNATAKIQGIDHTNDETLREYVRCAILNMFAKFLKQSACDGKWGLWYAWYTVEREMDESMGGVMKRVNCANEVYQNIQAAGWSMEQKIATWLSTDHKLKDRLGKAGVSNICKWELDKDGHIKGRKGTAHVDNTTHMIATNVTKPLTEGIKEILVDIKKEVKETIQRGLHTQQAPGVQGVQTPSPSPPGRSDHGSGESSGSAPAISGANEPATTPSSQVPIATKPDAPTPQAAKPAATKPATTKPATGGGGDQKGAKPSAPSAEGTSGQATSSTRSRSDGSAGEDVVQSQPTTGHVPAPPLAAPGRQTPQETTDGRYGKENVPRAKSACGTQTQTEDKKVGHAKVSVTISTVDSSYPGCSGSSTPHNDATGGATNSGSSATTDPAAAAPAPPRDAAPPGSSPHQPAPGLGHMGASGSNGSPGAAGDKGANGKPAAATAFGVGVLPDFPWANKNLDTVSGGFAPPYPEHKASSPSNTNLGTGSGGPDGPDLTGTVLTATTPVLFFLSAVIVALLGYSLWKYFAFLGQKRRTFRTVRDVPSPPLDEDILDHLQRGELPPPDYGYTMIRDTRAASAAERRRRHPRVHKRTIIELHLEVLHECAAAAWENVKNDYWQIVLQEFAQELMRDAKGYSSFPDAPSTNQALSGTNASSTDSEQTDRCPPNADDPDPCSGMETIQLATDNCAPNEHDPDPWSCMENIQLATDPCPPNEDKPDRWGCTETIQLARERAPPNAHNPCSCMATIPLATDPCRPNEDDRWNCMQTIQLDHEQHRPSDHGDETSACTHWINWIDRNKRILRACTTQPWFLQLKAEWKQYYQQHAPDDVSGNSELGEAATVPLKNLDAWKGWVAQQHALMHIYAEAEWFQHLLNNVEDETASHKGEVSVVEKDLEVEKVMAAEDVLHVRDVPRTQLHKQPDMTKPLTAQTWILLLALVIEQCEVERSLQEKELYVDALLQTC
ncbi:hypothetical protein AK88_05360 [Plasmodium fragile]|uniref:Schizont-infected cell agglutination C-terminal domain-containing protein n=1 Tax=Plasmodium fragile TaxID=5857 RepID=A0A0D9QD64_PLAFR|nr:uncharacterized protein AK88_05360 [Plasmodium fragile]KJP85005.1 hypothetical protein AK88_05360 [Plasmodium fragile]